MAGTDWSRIADWIWSRLEEEAPYISIEELLERARSLAEEIEEQSRFALSVDDIMEHFLEEKGSDLPELVAVGEEEEIEKAVSRYLYELREKVEELRKRMYGGGRVVGEEGEE